MAASTANIRFRMQNGSDHGPKPYDCSLTILALKEKLIQEWPSEPEQGPKDSSAEPPKSAADLKLILSGQILDNAKTLSELKVGKTLLENGSDSVVTMHLVVRLPNGPKSQGEGVKQEADKRMTRCSCVIA